MDGVSEKPGGEEKKENKMLLSLVLEKNKTMSKATMRNLEQI